MKIELTSKETDAVLWAIGQFTESNARDVSEMMSDGLTRAMAHALLRADDKLRRGRRLLKSEEKEQHEMS